MQQQLRHLALFLGPVLAALVYFLMSSSGFTHPASITAAIASLCAVWWIFEPIPIPATSLIPIAAFPAFDVLSAKQVAEAYGHWLILLLMGGFILSTALEKSGTHRRLALGMIRLVGSHSEKRIVFGFMVASAALSMWISNTATTLMLLPVAMAIIQCGPDNENTRKFAIALLLGLGYAANIGGVGTPIGTPPNLLFMNFYAQATGEVISFIDWMMWALPIVILFVPLMWLWLTRKLKAHQSYDLPPVGKWRTEEKRTMAVFAVVALLWIFRTGPYGGWSELLGLEHANDASVALLGVIAMFMIPNGKGCKLLDWETANKIPWGVLLLFAGGIAIASAFTASGLSEVIGNSMGFLTDLPPLLLIVSICLIVTFVTELTSNTATAALLMPILAAAGVAADMDPAILMFPAAISASCAFMLPVATGPNAVIFSSNRLSVELMVRNGFIMNLIGAGIITLVVYFLVGH